MIFANRIARGLWWERAWSLVEGCSPMSPGCDHCWSAAQAHMRAHQSNPKMQQRYAGVNHPDGRWNGHIKLLEKNLLLPHETNRPTVWAVWNDLFHENVPDDFIDSAFSIMAIANWHHFIILTKRYERLAQYFSAPDYDFWGDRWARNPIEPEPTVFPLPNVSIGITAENQEWWDIRKETFLNIPAAHRVVSCEPLLGPIHFTREELARIDQIIVGGESGPGARPMHPDCPRKIRDDCEAAGVAFFFKQWGNWGIDERGIGDDPDPLGRTAMAYRDGEVDVNWEPGARCRGAITMSRMKKKRAGRLLDGREHNDLIWAPAA